jgi:hypothetical protein
MEFNGSGRRRFLKHAAALAGVAAGAGAGAEWAARGQTAKPEEKAKDAPSSSETLRRGARMSDHITYYTPLQDYGGIITPASLHFVQYHASHFPDIDAKEHRLTIHGMVDRPLSFSMDDLKNLPSDRRPSFALAHGKRGASSWPRCSGCPRLRFQQGHPDLCGGRQPDSKSFARPRPAVTITGRRPTTPTPSSSTFRP